MDIKSILTDMENRMKKTLDLIRSEFSSVRTGKASPALVENIFVNYYGTPTRLKDLAGISTPDPKTIVIQPWDQTAVQETEKAILQTQLGITPVSDGKILRLPIPELSEERRVELAKLIKKMAEDNRIALRNIRRDAIESIKKLEKEKKITEDDKFKNEKTVQDKTESYIKQIDDLVKHKEKEIMEV
jgi:ribosome recycling factor